MRIDNSMNLNAMVATQAQVTQNAQTIADVANVVADPQNQEVTQDLIDAITSQIPNTIAYSANANAIQTQNETSSMLLNIKA
ncbi:MULTISPECIES: hypothetical protein [Malaciobacter]|jgi:hypothetical protein|uniref:Uncharacterized protein n=2 Tax=Malaciobacter TaxID=2321114 RepID=A0AB36ZV75_9BACT|nr:MULTISPECIES: hypothetical protein [Malaciobacter]PHO10893.1 hypothetical protein CPG37_00135 [Malaciobacter canalis]PPK60787.1 hypothetical protein B0F89_11637 [Malaciobacter marinus]QEE32963.1 hypothetical protein ACAN_1487 [Malaciobacter canalis]SKB41471.1 hypothetical protein SAMN06295997_11052 [Malaciobacter marinus]